MIQTAVMLLLFNGKQYKTENSLSCQSLCSLLKVHVEEFLFFK